MLRAGPLGICLPLAFLAACGNESSPPTRPTFAYVLSAAPGLSAYRVDNSTGAWSLVGTILDDIGPVALDPQGRYLFAALHDPKVCSEGGWACNMVTKVVTYQIDPSTGALSQAHVKDGFFANGAAIGLYASGRFLYVTDLDDGPTSVLEVDSAGVLNSARVPDSSWYVVSSAVDPTGRFLYYGSDYLPFLIHRPSDIDQPLAVWQADLATGSLTYMGKQGAGTRAAIDPSGRHLYSSMPVAGQVGVFTLDSATGSLSALEGAPSLETPGALVVHPSGRLLYLANAHDILAYRLDDVAGTLSLIHVVAAGVTDTQSGLDRNHPQYSRPDRSRCELALDPAGRFLFVLRHADVLGYSVSATTGDLSPIPQAEGFNPGTVAAQGGFWIGLVNPAH
jgi:DNA-binding beta-propeller fold protein YncE